MLRHAIAVLLIPFAVGAQDLEIHHIDVDQGDATLLVMPNGRSMLVEAGLHSRGPVVAEYLADLGITELAALVVIHYDGDHMGGVDVLGEEGIEIAAFYDHGDWNPDACDEEAEESNQQECQYQEFVIEQGDSAIALVSGDQTVLDSAVSVMVGGDPPRNAEVRATPAGRFVSPLALDPVCD